MNFTKKYAVLITHLTHFANLASFNGLTVIEADGADPADASEKIAEAVSRVRGNPATPPARSAGRCNPCLLRMRVPRLGGHTFIDDQAYKTAARLAGDQARPASALARLLVEWKNFPARVEWNTFCQTFKPSARKLRPS